jgi:hypothetical protein
VGYEEKEIWSDNRRRLAEVEKGIHGTVDAEIKWDF